uniref:Cytochrome c-type biogenesis protein n=1 Tax=Candidatus Kentrum sp. MB TaxID=2138164 RepID=A0A450XMU8_9GAMM|nr:MAG: cytochrome c-type biogenesis protein CcmH [Candidatus Kentron sp. MB]VFK34853.1 MAG: cytochrome c-type biogenesis protein CcmH [Candidatus Kentron sp. MB]VFK77004.1 MAG: cytochrome c-type biogenesis protein CcmH [Candidatus Kentron sp. MB]
MGIKMHSPRLLSFTFFFLFFTMILGNAANASVFEPRDFANPAQEGRYKTLIEELRCLVCQNQSLADSNAELAADLRREVYDMVASGADEEAVKEFMVSRYSEYVLYRPPVTITTLLLWAGPFLFALAGLVILIVRVRRRAFAPTSAPLSDHEEKRLAEMLMDAPGKDTRG